MTAAAWCAWRGGQTSGRGGGRGGGRAVVCSLRKHGDTGLGVARRHSLEGVGAARPEGGGGGGCKRCRGEGPKRWGGRAPPIGGAPGAGGVGGGGSGLACRAHAWGNDLCQYGAPARWPCRGGGSREDAGGCDALATRWPLRLKGGRAVGASPRSGSCPPVRRRGCVSESPAAARGATAGRPSRLCGQTVG